MTNFGIEKARKHLPIFMHLLNLNFTAKCVHLICPIHFTLLSQLCSPVNERFFGINLFEMGYDIEIYFGRLNVIKY